MADPIYSRRYFPILLGFIAVLLMAMVVCNSTYFTRWRLLKEMPVGTKFDQVLMYCARSNLKCFHSDTAGYMNQDTDKAVGVKSIWATLSDKNLAPFVSTAVQANWGFDSNGGLVVIIPYRKETAA